jgi:hypothetical protein
VEIGVAVGALVGKIPDQNIVAGKEGKLSE